MRTALAPHHGGRDPRADTGGSARPNILVVVADDLGIEQMRCYGEPRTHRAPQPTLQGLCSRGLVFDRAWSNPLCSPTRAGMLTGRYAHRHMVGEPVGGISPGLSTDEVLIPAALDALEAGYAHAAIGKWHLRGDEDGDDHPNTMGFSHYAGNLAGQVEAYDSYVKVTDGVGERETAYATSETVDDAIAWLDEQEDPWFLWLSFNAGHTPYHLPPSDLHSFDDLDEITTHSDPLPYYLAMVEAMDTELGRLLDHLGRLELENTWIIFVGDNGSESEVNQGMYLEARSKGSLFEGGVHVPLLVVGPGLASPGRHEDAIVGTVDIFSTVLELAGVDPADLGVELDSVSLVPYLEDFDAADQRETLVAEVFGPKTAGWTAGQAIRDSRWKYIRKLDGTEYLYDLQVDPLEGRNLTGMAGPPAEALARLQAELDTMPIDTWWESDTGG